MKVSVNGKSYDVEVNGNDVRVNGKKLKIEQKSDEIIIGQDQFFLDYIDNGEPSLFVINGMSYLVSKTSSKENRVKEVKAPINGQIIEVLAKEGRNVAKGELLVTLEAMKMENQIKSPSSGRINEVKVRTGQLVKTGEILVTFL